MSTQKDAKVIRPSGREVGVEASVTREQRVPRGRGCEHVES